MYSFDNCSDDLSCRQNIIFQWSLQQQHQLQQQCLTDTTIGKTHYTFMTAFYYHFLLHVIALPHTRYLLFAAFLLTCHVTPYTKWSICGQGPVWPDLAKFRHFGKSSWVVGKFLMVYLLFVQNADPTLANLLHFRLIFIVANGQILNNNLVTLPRTNPSKMLACTIIWFSQISFPCKIKSKHS